MPQMGSVQSKLVQLKHIADRGLGQNSNRWAIVILQKKIAILTLFEATFLSF